MTGLLVTGHGGFASGMSSSLRMISGDQGNYQSVDFTDGMTPQELERNLRKALEQLYQKQGIIILTDIIGGSPFQVSVKIAQEFSNFRVVGGINLPLLCDISLERMGESSKMEQLILSAMETGKKQMGFFSSDYSLDEMTEKGGI
ncbi:PTS galactosamine/N-acetylgalactosamine transporter subunit IIA [Caproiciproducens sp.]|uniref:PTS galactosamine/N-acetylgalactosamine transporter subunit IIA n=1 Tax=Caproiciproducens sp. TaxID=1954376 RepID=UPI00289E77DB|nr:PTS galactosamine/N-acetylgalactosamine transporter subunit IIA [Caproiciproducens sp.]